MDQSVPSDHYNKTVSAAGLVVSAKASDAHLHITLAFVILNGRSLSGSVYLHVNKRAYKLTDIKRRAVHVRLCTVSVPYADLVDSDIHNKLLLAFKDAHGKGFAKPIFYGLLPAALGTGKHTALKVFAETDGTVYLRQSLANRAYITHRRRNASDDKKLHRRMTLAYYASLFLGWKRVVLLYEKESAKYEESAAAVFEKLMDSGYRDAYFVIDPASPHMRYIADKYRSHILHKHSFKHYLYFFVAKSFIGTELPGHAIDLRVANKYAVRKVKSRSLRYVFLQHGVMYMVSLSSLVRQAARKRGGAMPHNNKTVVSSLLEATHFVEHGDYDMDDLYITGLPKFDRAVRSEAADRIVIMPTWRPWEYNRVRTSPEETGYYRMIQDIVQSVPAELRDKVQVLPHPLFIREMQKSDLAQYMAAFDSYDEVLREADLLITDYSSIAYDAFFRGANVVFWWKDKDYCMEQYGGSLMLDEHNVFGDVAYNKKQLTAAVRANYGAKQAPAYVAKYRKIVSFKDRKNTARLIDMLYRDKII